jgi:hypothetical protein
VAYGTAQEWGQEKTDIRTNWNNIGAAYEGILKQRKANPDWPLSYIIDGSSGHFDCSERLTRYFARYIDLAARARLSDDGSPNLKPIKLDQGCLADLPVPGHEGHPVTTFAQTAPDERAVPWYFDRASAGEAQAFAAINWKADTQLPAFTDAKGSRLPFTFNGISSLTPEMESDGITFTLRGVMLEQLPENFVGAGEKLASAPGKPAMEWLCGPVLPLGGDKYRLGIDRSWPSSACYLAARQPGTANLRAAVQPCGIKLQKNNTGLAQKINFDPIPDVKRGTKSLALSAKSSAGLPVRFFVRAGPAVIEGDQLIFTPVPPRSRLPLTLMVGAWQWGRTTDPAVQTAPVVEQQFRILPEP